MSASWSHILERAGADLAHDQTASASGLVADRRSKRNSRQISKPIDPIADARDLLARELEVMSAPASPHYKQGSASTRERKNLASGGLPLSSASYETQIAVPLDRPSIKRHWGRNLAAVVVSSGVIVSTVYAFSQEWQSEAVAAKEVVRESFSFSEIGHANAASGSADVKSPLRETSPQPVTPAQTPLSEQEEDVFLYRASKMLESGDIEGARWIYQNLASHGSQRGAVGIAETYDPKIVPNVQIKGLKADVETARAWYKRALELGDRNASIRIKALDSAVN